MFLIALKDVAKVPLLVYNKNYQGLRMELGTYLQPCSKVI